MSSTNDTNLGDSRNLARIPEIMPVPATANAVTQRLVTMDTPNGVSEGSDINISRYLHSLRRNWLLGGLLGIMAAGPLAYLAWSLLPMKYTAEEFLRVSPTQTSLIFDSGETVNRADFKIFKNTQKQLLLQPYALNKALKDSDVAQVPAVRANPNPIGWLQKELKVEFPDEAEIMRVSLEASDPLTAHKIVKAVVDTYMSDVVDKEKFERLARLETLEKILRETEDKVRKKRSELSNLVGALGMSDKSTVDLSQQLTLQQFGQIRSQLAKTNFEIMGLQSELDLRKSLTGPTTNSVASHVKFEENAAGDLSGADVNSSAVSTAEHKDIGSNPVAVDPALPNPGKSSVKNPKLEELLESDSEASKLAREVERLQNFIRNAPQRYDAKTAATYVAKYQAKLEDAQSKLAEREKRLEQRLPESYSGLSETEVIAAKIGVFQKQQDLLREEMAGLMDESKKFGRSSIDVEMLRKEIDALEPMVTKVNQNVERTKIELQSASRITRFQSGGVPTIGENKKRLPLTAAAGMLGLFGPLTLLILRDIFRNHVNNSGEISDGMKISLLGSIPRVPSRVMKRLSDPNHQGAMQWRERIEESITGVTALLLRKQVTEGNRIIMVSSAATGEGKSTLSELLARNLAQSGHKTLLIDFDLRRPKLHHRLKLALAPGVSEVLREGADLKQTIQNTSSPNLDILTAGQSPGNLLLEAANGTFETLFKECRADYEMVIVDTSPLLPVVDGRLVGQFCDGAIMTVTKDSSQMHRVLASRSILDDYGIPVLGCVIIGESSDDYYGSYGQSREVRNAVEKGVKSSRSMSAM